MAKLAWDVHQFEVGVDRGVFFRDGIAEAWNGLVSVEETPTELRSRVRYRDGVKVVNHRSEDSFSATIQSYTYPDGVLSRKPFHFSYRVNTAEGYKTHLVYNALAVMGNRVYSHPEASTFSFDVTTKPIAIPGARPSAHLVVDTDKAYLWTVSAFENVLYGSSQSTPRMPSPEEVFNIFEVNSILRIIDNRDGTWTATGPDEVIHMLDDTTFEITWPSIAYFDGVTYSITSL